MSIKLTIFTPTYNRANTIGRTYDSLKGQKSKDFEWLVIDDGSSDNTEELFKEWEKDGFFKITYIKKVNEGKYRAYNLALEYAVGEYFLVLDSDDILANNAVENIISYDERLKYSKHIMGILSLKSTFEGRLIGDNFLNIKQEMSLFELRKQNRIGEYTMIFKTDIVRQYPFPMETNEKFMTECIVYDQFSKKYDFVLVNEVHTICEYQSDGLSSMPIKLMLKNPAGYKLFFSQRIDFSCSLKELFKSILSYNSFKILYKGHEYEYNGNKKYLVKFLYPLGFLLLIYYKVRSK